MRDVYLNTDYRVTLPSQTFVLRIGRFSAEIKDCFRPLGVPSAAFITAWNPYSVGKPEIVNAAAQARLEAEILASGYAFVRGIGEDPSGRWSGEASVLVWGLGREAAADIGRRYGQNAVVWIGEEAVPELLELEDLS